MNSKKLFFLSILVIALAITSCNSKQIAEDAFVLKIDLSDISEEIPDRSKVDYHPEYGVIKPNEFPVKKEGWSAENILGDVGIQKEEMKILFVTKKLYTGKLLSEHMVEDNKIIYVWHEYKDEPIIITASETNEGDTRVKITLMQCNNSGTPSPYNLISEDNMALRDFISHCLAAGVTVIYS